MEETLKVVKQIFAYIEIIDAKIEALSALLLENRVLNSDAYSKTLGEIRGDKTHKWNEYHHLLSEAIKKDKIKNSPLDEQLNTTGRN